jgi:hypothetical protein
MACILCHQAIYEKYTRTAMGRSITRPDASMLPAPITLRNEQTNRQFQVIQENGELFQVESQSRNGVAVWETRHKLEFAIGSGENGITFAVRRGNHLFQAPVSYYSAARIWDLSPGFEQAGAGFERPIYEECIVCHAGRSQAVAHRDGLYRDPPFAELAIGCENCHGPGALHIAERSAGKGSLPDTAIVNPRRLPPRLAEDICMRCHQAGDARVLLPGKLYGDFRPGTRLIDTMAIVALADGSKDADLLEHHESLKLSACYRATDGKLSCLTCHDPHEQPGAAEAPEYFRRRCMRCHTDRSCRLDLASRRNTMPADNCIGCHMPKRAVDRISHSALTNHRIPVRAGTPAPSIGNRGGLAGLRILNADASGAQLPLVARLAAYGELTARAPTLGPDYSALLDEASRSAPEDPVVLAAVGHKALLENNPDAASWLSKAIARGAPGAILHLDLSQALEKAGRLDESVAALERGEELFPFSPEIRKRLVLGYIRQKSYVKAQSAMERYVVDFPEDDFMRGLLRQVLERRRP